MLRSIGFLLLGLTIGLASGLYFVASAPDSTTQKVERAAGNADQSSGERTNPGKTASNPLANNTNSHQERLDFYQRTASANATDLAAMIDEVAATADSPARRFAAEILLSRYAEIDPRNALATARKFRFGPAITASVYAVWARSDRDAALAAIASETDSRIAKSAGVLMVEELGGDSSALLDVLDALPEYVDGLGFQIDVLVAQTEYDPVAATRFHTLAMADPEKLLPIADQWSGSVAERARTFAIRQWAEHEPQRALEFVDELPPGQQRDNLLSSVARGYGKTDVEAALAWANNLQPKPRGILQAVIDGVAEEDASRAFDLALGLPTESDQMEALQGVLMRSAYGDQDATIIANRILTLESDRLRRNSLRMLGYTWAQQDPAAVLGWLSANSAQMPKDAFGSVARQLAEADPQLAAEYLPGCREYRSLGVAVAGRECAGQCARCRSCRRCIARSSG